MTFFFTQVQFEHELFFYPSSIGIKVQFVLITPPTITQGPHETRRVRRHPSKVPQLNTDIMIYYDYYY